MVQVMRYLTLALASLALTVALQACNEREFAPEYAISRLDLANGKAIYFKREVRGITGNYDVVAISTDGNPCTSVNDDTDYCICSWQPYVYYKLEDDSLHLYYATADHAAAKDQFPVKVVNHEINPMDVKLFEHTYWKLGIVRLDLAVDATKRCL